VMAAKQKRSWRVMKTGRRRKYEQYKIGLLNANVSLTQLHNL